MSNSKKMDTESDQHNKDAESKTDKEPSEFIIGLVTFIVFLVFMTVWMYFGLKE